MVMNGKQRLTLVDCNQNSQKCNFNTSNDLNMKEHRPTLC